MRSIGRSIVGKRIVINGVLLTFVLETIYLNNVFSDSPISTVLLQVLILLISVAVTLTYLVIPIDVITFCGFLLCLTMVFSAVFSQNESSINLISIISKAFLWFFIYLLGYLGTRFYNCEKQIIRIASVACMVFIFLLTLNLNTDFDIGRASTVVTSIYYLLCCMPFVFCIKKNTFKTVIFIITILLLAISFKRSALIVSLIAIIFLLWFNRKKNKRLIYYAIIIIIAALSISLIYVAMTSVDTKIADIFEIWEARFSVENSSRIDILNEVFYRLKYSNLGELFFGHGYNAVMYDTSFGLSAHNDYVEILYDYGLISFGAFCWLIVNFIKKRKIIEQIDSNLHNGYICALVIFIVASIPSHMLTYSTYFLMISLYLGYANGICDKNLFDEKEKFNYRLGK